MHDDDESGRHDTIRMPAEDVERLRRATIRPPEMPVLCRACLSEMLHDGVAMTYECLDCGEIVPERCT